MDEQSKIPSWLKDRKKLIIIGLVLLSMIVSGFNTYAAAQKIAGRIIDIDQVEENIETKVKNALADNSLEGMYQNIYAEEYMQFTKDGTVLYMYGSDFLMGTYELSGDTLYMNLNGYDYVFQVIENSDSSLILNNGGYELTYVKTF